MHTGAQFLIIGARKWCEVRASFAFSSTKVWFTGQLKLQRAWLVIGPIPGRVEDRRLRHIVHLDRVPP